MKTRRLCLWGLASLWAILVFCLSPVHAGAFDEGNCQASYQAVDGSGDVKAMVLTCAPGFATERDQVTIYARGRALDARLPWQQNVTFEAEVWVFDAGADGQANLIIDFRRDGEALVADLYDDQNNDGHVAYRWQRGDLVITESDFWTVQLKALDGWWMRQGRLNFNLDVAVDGPVMAVASFDRFLDELPTDGHVDFHIRVRDLDNSGQGEYDLRWSSTPLPESWGLRRVNLAVSEQNRALPLRGQVFWPYLGTVYGPLRYADGTLILVPYRDPDERVYGFIQGYQQFAPPIQVGWQKSKIVFVAEFVPSRGGEDNWFVYAIPPYHEGEVYRADFENPFGFYDLVGDDDGMPELLVRVEGYAADDIYSPLAHTERPFSSVRYCWDQDNDGAWDYTLNLHGVVDLATDTVLVDDFALVTVPYPELPSRVLESQWDHAAFVSHMAGGFVGMEGMYVWGMPYKLRDQYFSGNVDTPPLDLFQEIAQGYRGEVALQPGLSAKLYFSPVDRLLHLGTATFGVWQMSDSRQMLYENLNGDAYLDHWRYTRAGQLESDLYFAAQHLIYHDPEGVAVSSVDVPVSLFEVAPPATQAEWALLNQSLEAQRGEFAPQDIGAMMAQFGEPDWRLRGGTLREFHYEQDGRGFRFVLTLAPDFQVMGMGGPQIEGHAPGVYQVTYYEGAGFKVAPLAEPRLVVEPVSIHPEKLVERAPVVVEALVQNISAADTDTLSVTLYAQPLGGTAKAVAAAPVKLRAHEVQYVTLTWTPDQAGDWRIWLDLDVAVRAPGPDVVEEIRVAPMPRPTLAWSLGLTNAEGRWAFVLWGALLAMSVVSGAVVIRQYVSVAQNGEKERGKRMRSEFRSRKVGFESAVIWLVMLTVLALGARVGYAVVAGQIDPFLLQDPLWGDAGSYDRIARNLLAGIGYSQYPPEADVFWPPLYPLLLGLVYKLLGYNVLLARVVQAMVGALVPGVLYLMGRALFDERAGRLAGLGAALYPYLIYFGAWLIADGPYITLLTLTLCTAFFLQKHLSRCERAAQSKAQDYFPNTPLHRRSVAMSVLLGVLLGLDILMKPVTLAFLPFLLLWFLFALRGAFWRRVGLGIVTLGVLLAVLAPWVWRNHLVTGEWVLVSTNGGFTFYGANTPDAFGGHREGFPRRIPGMSPVAQEREFYRRGWAWMVETPQDFLALVPRKLARLVSPLSVASREAPYPLPFARVVYGIYWAFLALAVYGWVRSLSNWREAGILYVPMVAVLCNVVLFYGDTRYSLPMVPSLVIFAAKALSDAWDWVEHARASETVPRDPDSPVWVMDEQGGEKGQGYGAA